MQGMRERYPLSCRRWTMRTLLTATFTESVPLVYRTRYADAHCLRVRRGRRIRDDVLAPPGWHGEVRGAEAERAAVAPLGPDSRCLVDLLTRQMCRSSLSGDGRASFLIGWRPPFASRTTRESLRFPPSVPDFPVRPANDHDSGSRRGRRNGATGHNVDSRHLGVLSR